MPGRPHIYTASFTADVPESAANTETVAMTIPGCTSEFAGQQIALSALLTIQPGTTATAMTVRIRQDTLTGTIVGEAEVEGAVTPSKSQTFAAYGVDGASEIAGRSYVVTFQGTGEGTAATAQSGIGSCTIS